MGFNGGGHEKSRSETGFGEVVWLMSRRAVRCACAGTLGFVCFGALLDRPEHFSFHDQVDRVEQEKGRVGVSQWGRRSPRTRMRSRHVGGTPTVHLVALY